MNISSTSLFAVLCLASIYSDCNSARGLREAVFRHPPVAFMCNVSRDQVAFQKWRKVQLAEAGKSVLTMTSSESVEGQIARQLQRFARDKGFIMNIVNYEGWTVPAINELFAWNEDLQNVKERIQRLRHTCKSGLSRKIRACAARSALRLVSLNSDTLIGCGSLALFKAWKNGLLVGGK